MGSYETNLDTRVTFVTYQNTYTCYTDSLI